MMRQGLRFISIKRPKVNEKKAGFRKKELLTPELYSSMRI